MTCATGPSAAEDDFCGVLKRVVADIDNDFKAVRTGSERADGTWATRLALPGMVDCEVEDFDGFSYTCKARVASRAEAIGRLAHFETLIGDCFPRLKALREPDKRGLPTLTYELPQTDSGYIHVSMSSVLRSYTVFLTVDGGLRLP